MDVAVSGVSPVVDVATAIKGGFWRRVGAVLIDGIILGIVGGILQQIFGAGVGGGISTLIGIVYAVYFWTTTGQTIGHRVLGLRVVKTDGTTLDIVGAIVRYVGEIIAAIPLGLGFLWAAWDSEKQGWHDKLAKTYVVRV